ncbi:MAG: FHA domain-containing protein [Caldithrix sp.]|nr:FHA domain-containing protein [Caldithrix sp.]
MSVIECAYCGHENRPDCNFCTQCGAKLKEEKTGGPRLKILTKDENSIVFKLEKPKSTIGRGIENDIVVDDKQVSKIHAAIYLDNNSIQLEDLNSSNGVYVNGKKISSRFKIFDGNLIRLGTTILKLETEDLSP